VKLRKIEKREADQATGDGRLSHSQGMDHKYLGVAWEFSCFRFCPVLG